MDNLSLLQWEKALKEMLHPECSQLMVSSILISICLKEIVFNRQPNQINWALLPGSCSAAVSVRGIWNVRLQTAQPREWWCTPAILAFRRQKQTGESRVQGYPWQHSCTEASLGYLRLSQDQIALLPVQSLNTSFPPHKRDGDICLLILWIQTSSKHTWEVF